MEELKFSPSPAVWKNLETELDKEKKRRRPIFWFLLFAGIGVGGAMIYVSSNHRQVTSSQFTRTATAIDPADHSTISQDRISTGKSNAVALQEGNPNDTHQSVKKISSANGLVAYKSKAAFRKPVKPFDGNRLNQRMHGGLSSDAAASVEKKDPVTTENDPISQTVTDSSDGTGSANPAIAKANEQLKADSANQILPQPLLALQKKDSSAAVVKTKKANTSKTKGWKIGLVFSPGVSAQQTALFTNASFNLKPVATVMAFAVPQSYSAAPYNPTVYSFRPAFSWSAGINVRKTLSAHWDVSGGVNYHYSSTRVTASASAANIYNSALINAANYNKLTDYRNSFHFIDIPVTAGYTLNKNSRLPVRIEGGLILSEFLSGQGLQYDNGVYYGKYNTLNKTQLGASFGIQLGMVSGRNTFEFGPQIQYGLTDLMRASGVSAQHLLFGGITLRVMRKTK